MFCNGGRLPVTTIFVALSSSRSEMSLNGSRKQSNPAQPTARISVLIRPLRRHCRLSCVPNGARWSKVDESIKAYAGGRGDEARATAGPEPAAIHGEEGPDSPPTCPLDHFDGSVRIGLLDGRG